MSGQNITNTLIIPKNSNERFLFNSDHLEEEWNNKGILVGGISELTPGYKVVRHNPNFHVYLQCLQGEVEVHGPKEIQVLKPGDFAWIPAKGLHHYESSVSLKTIWLHIDPGHERWKKSAIQKFYIGPTHTTKLFALFEFLHVEANLRSKHNDTISNDIGDLIVKCVEREFDLEESLSQNIIKRKFNRLWQEVDNNLAYSWTIAELAQMASMSTPHFHAKVQELYYQTPFGMVTMLRMKKAQALLRHTNLTLEVISEQTGYSSAFALSRAFKRLTGLSPRSFKNSLK